MADAFWCVQMISILWALACFALIPISFGGGYGTKDLLHGDDGTNSKFEYCIQDLTIDTLQPPEIEIWILIGCGYGLSVVFCCICCASNYVSKSENPFILGCLGCLAIIGTMAITAIFIHIYMYLTEIQEKDEGASCVDDGALSIFSWIEAGFYDGCIVSSLCCCVCCCAVFCGALQGENEDVTPTKTNAQTTIQMSTPVTREASPSPRPVMTVARREPSPSPQPQVTEQQMNNIAGLFSLALIEECGFCIATPNNKRLILNRLNNVTCTEGTALRDAVIYGIKKMLALKMVIAKLGAIEHKFVHIVLTDGMDNRSQCSLIDTQLIFLQLGREIGDICTTFFIGIELGSQEEAELQSIADLGGDAAELYNCQDVQLSDVFDRIKVRVGIRRQVAVITDGSNVLAAQRDQLYLTAEQQKFLVLFTLDKSGSMSGGRWRSVCAAVNGFCQAMGQTDILGVILFNDKVECITD